MDTFTTRLKQLTEVLRRSKETELDYSLKDARKIIEGLPNPPFVHLEESDRGPMRDISMYIRWDNHCVTIKLVASERFFAMRNGSLTINGTLTDWTWSPNYAMFECNSTEEQRYAYWDFLTSITNVL